MSVKETLYSQRRALLDRTCRSHLLSLRKQAGSKFISTHSERGDRASRLPLRKAARRSVPERAGAKAHCIQRASIDEEMISRYVPEDLASR